MPERIGGDMVGLLHGEYAEEPCIADSIAKALDFDDGCADRFAFEAGWIGVLIERDGR